MIRYIFLTLLVLLVVLPWQSAVAQPTLPACAMNLTDNDNDGVSQALDVDKDNDGLIEICDLEGLDEIRYALRGVGYRKVAAGDISRQGCPTTGCIGYELVTNLDFNSDNSYRDSSNKATWAKSATSAGWEPIKSDSGNFNAVFDGNGNFITNLYINKESGDSIGLFSRLTLGGEIKNISLTNVRVTGHTRVGSLVGYLVSGSITNSSARGGTVKGIANEVYERMELAGEESQNIGGLVGYNDGSIINSDATVNVTGTGEYAFSNNVGGLVGYNDGSIINSDATGYVTGTGNFAGGVGGLVGENYGPIISSYAIGDVRSPGKHATNLGGLVGRNYGPIVNSYATGAITGVGDQAYYIGGLVGTNNSPIINSYATGAISGNYAVGGLVGNHASSIINSYATGNVTGIGGGEHAGRIGSLVGLHKGSITNSYAIGRVSGRGSHIGGLVGIKIGLITASYWNSNRNSDQLKFPTAPGMHATDIYYGWSGSDWDFGDSTHYPALRYATGDALNACDSDIIAISPIEMPPCGILLPNQSGRNEGLAGVLFTVGGEQVAVESTPLFSPLVYDYRIKITTIDMTMQLRPYALNKFARARITDQDGTDYTDYANLLDGAPSNVITLDDDETIIRLYIESTYTFVIERLLPISFEVSPSQLNVRTTDGTGYSYQWQKQVLGAGWTNIANAVSSTYMLPSNADGSIRYRVNIRYTNSQGYTVNYPTQGPFRANIDDDGDGLIDIYTLEDLDEIRYQLDGSGYRPTESTTKTTSGCPAAGCSGYELRRSLNFNTDASYRSAKNKAAWTTGDGWQPIGPASGSYFNSVFEGNGHTIANLYIDYYVKDQIGLFSLLSTAGQIKNVSLIANIQGRSQVGGLVGVNRGKITNSGVIGGTVAGWFWVGGLVGQNRSTGEIISNSARVSVTRRSDTRRSEVGNIHYAGGLVGRNNGLIINSYATGNVTYGGTRLGGLAGENLKGVISNSYATGNVAGTKNHIGGLVGYTDDSGRIENTYAKGNVSGAKAVGGLVGRNDGSITNSYAIGLVSGSGRNIGSLVGVKDSAAIITASYWNSDTSGQTTSAGGTAKTTTELQSPITATGIYSSWDTANWDFAPSDRYPALRYSAGDSGNACNTNIVTSPGLPMCGRQLPSQHLTGVRIRSKVFLEGPLR